MINSTNQKKIETLNLTDLVLDPEVQARTELDPKIIKEYAEAMKAGSKFPPIIVFGDWVADGFHRVEAAKKAGLTSIEADIRPGTKRDAILFAVGANATHGIRRTNADKKRAVEILLKDPEWVLWSDREIARQVQVSVMTVGRVRKNLSVTSYR
jgi:hypothetical protein